MQKEEIEFLKEANHFLENPSFVTKVTEKLGKPIEFAMNKLSLESQEKIGKVTETALRKALVIAHKTIFEQKSDRDFEEIQKSNHLSRIGHNIAAASTGAVGGFFGELGLVAELPVTTTLIMRSILSQGQKYQNFTKEELIVNSIYVFSLGSSKSSEDDDMSSSYYSSRLMMDYTVRKSAEYLATSGPKGLLKSMEAGSAPLLLDLVSRVLQRFNVSVTEKMLVQAVPVVGAIGGAGINLLFTDFFTSSARYHFGIKALEAKYGQEQVQLEYRNNQNPGQA